MQDELEVEITLPDAQAMLVRDAVMVQELGRAGEITFSGAFAEQVRAQLAAQEQPQCRKAVRIALSITIPPRSGRVAPTVR